MDKNKKNQLNESKKGIRIKGDLLYNCFSGFEAGNFSFLKEKYIDMDCIEKHCNEEMYDKFTELLENLEKKGAISKEEFDFLHDMIFFYFNAFIEWIDNNDNVKILIG